MRYNAEHYICTGWLSLSMPILRELSRCGVIIVTCSEARNRLLNKSWARFILTPLWTECTGCACLLEFRRMRREIVETNIFFCYQWSRIVNHFFLQRLWSLQFSTPRTIHVHFKLLQVEPMVFFFWPTLWHKLKKGPNLKHCLFISQLGCCLTCWVPMALYVSLEPGLSFSMEIV